MLKLKFRIKTINSILENKNVICCDKLEKLKLEIIWDEGLNSRFCLLNKMVQSSLLWEDEENHYIDFFYRQHKTFRS